MARTPRRSFSRKSASRDRKIRFLIATEGHITEEIYFKALAKQVTVEIKSIPSKHKSNPTSVLNKILTADDKLEKNDERWIVIDTDLWGEKELSGVLVECNKNNIGMAVSNPQFEFWLLLHLDDGRGANTKRACLDRLDHHIPNFSENKRFDPKKFIGTVADAIDRAKAKDVPRTESWPRTVGSTVYKLVENILDKDK